MGRDVVGRLVPADRVLPHLSAVSVTEPGLRRVTHGNSIGAQFLEVAALPVPGPDPVRILSPDGRLVALAHVRGGALHPVVVLG
jgi:hypothetical protein